MTINEFVEKRYYDMVAWARHCLPSAFSEDADDVVADTIITLQGMDIKEDTAYTFVCKVIKNKCYNIQRDSSRRATVLRDRVQEVQSGLGYLQSESTDPADIVEAEEELDDKVKELSPLLRAALTKHYIEGKGVEEIAKEEGSDPARNTLKGDTQ
jgi:RNA polymerase sigma factor (sigma-70 family)